jgi:hypothetical protein
MDTAAERVVLRDVDCPKRAGPVVDVAKDESMERTQMAEVIRTGQQPLPERDEPCAGDVGFRGLQGRDIVDSQKIPQRAVG